MLVMCIRLLLHAAAGPVHGLKRKVLKLCLMPLVGIKSGSALVVDRMGNDLSSIRKRKGDRKMPHSPPSCSQPPDVFSICGTVLSVVKLLPIHPSLGMGLRESASCVTVSNSSHLQKKLVTFFLALCSLHVEWLRCG